LAATTYVNIFAVDMKSKTPTILSYEQLVDEFENHIHYRPALTQGRLNMMLENDRNRILKVLKKHKMALDEIEEVILDFIHKAIMIRPPVYIVRTTDVKTGIVYFNGKTVIPLKGGKKKEFKIYIGKASDFNNDTTNDLARIHGERIMKQTLLKKVKEGELM
jgi:hypothetical protein